MSWIQEIEAVQNIDNLKTSHSITGDTFSHLPDAGRHDRSGFEELTLTNFNRKEYLEEQRAQADDRFVRTRQIARMINEQIRLTGSSECTLEFADLMSILLSEETMFKDVTQNGTKFFYLLVEKGGGVPRMRSWKVCTDKNSEIRNS